MKHGLSENVVAQVHTVLASHPAVQSATLYGSRAMGNYKNGSDIDLTLFGDGLTYDEVMSIAGDLDDTSIPHTVDVSIFDKLNNDSLKDHIRRVGVVFYTRNK
jgi:uncharacterized protein